MYSKDEVMLNCIDFSSDILFYVWICGQEMFGLFAGNYQKALEKYKVIHRKFPENVECKLFH